MKESKATVIGTMNGDATEIAKHFKKNSSKMETEQTTTKEANMLYRVHKTNRLFGNFKFLCSAIGQNKVDAQTYSRILVEEFGGKLRLVATDSHSLHVLDLERLEGLEIETGDYEVIKADSKEIILFRREFDEPFVPWKKIAVCAAKPTSVISSLAIRRNYDEDAIYELYATGLKVELCRLNNLAGHEWKVGRDKRGTVAIFTSENLQANINLSINSESEGGE